MKRKIRTALCFTKDKALREAGRVLEYKLDVEIKTISAKHNPRVNTRPFVVSAICRNKDDAETARRLTDE